MIYLVYLLDAARSGVQSSFQTYADNREDALGQRPGDWPLSRTRAHRQRVG